MQTEAPRAATREGLLRFWRYSRALLAPLLIWVLLVGPLIQPLLDWLESEDRYDQGVVQEWIEESRDQATGKTLSDLVGEYVESLRAYARAPREDSKGKVVVHREQIYLHLRTLGEATTKKYQSVLPLFPVVYRIEVELDAGRLPADLPVPEADRRLREPIVWDSGLNPSSVQYRTADVQLRNLGTARIHYQLHALNKRQRNEQIKARRLKQLALLGLAATGLGLAWLMLVQADERERQRQRRLAHERVERAERQVLEQERQRIEAERELLAQRLGREAAERHALELKSHLYASIGIMAGSYAHNIKNLLVRPNDLLRRCLEREDVPAEQARMLREVQQTLGLVTERLQQILHTVRRDPSQARLEKIDLNAVLRDLARTWSSLAAERWQLDLALELAEGPAWVEADVSHLQQAVENLLFNARDATFEMRNHLRDAARKSDGPHSGANTASRRQALIAAAAWRGRVLLRVRRLGDEVVLEVTDNGAGMTEEVKKRCTETHFSTKRDNALYEGHSTGMGLGLSFVTTILEHHRAKLEIESELQRGTTFRARFPAAAPAEPASGAGRAGADGKA